MSSIVRNINMHLICASNLLPKDIMVECFMDTINELNMHLSNNTIVFRNSSYTKVTIGERIVIHTDSEQITSIEKDIHKLRELFTRRALIAHRNYQNELQYQSSRMMSEQMDSLELKKAIENLEKLKSKSEEALKIQNLPSCDALVEELKIAAINKGYEVIHNQGKDEVQLQFVRRQY